MVLRHSKHRYSLISTQMYSLFDETPPRPLTSYSKVRLPECYNVTNVQDLYGKIPSFGDETLLWIFYSRPLDKAQHKAAQVLHSRNWRWHRKHHVWLTKDEQLPPTLVTQNYERGYYIVWDAQNWRKERVSFSSRTVSGLVLTCLHSVSLPCTTTIWMVLSNPTQQGSKKSRTF